MGEPVTVNIPHELGVAEAKTRIGNGIHTLDSVIPGAHVTEHHWEGDNMECTITALGQNIGCEMQVRDDEVYAIFDLPPMLALFANKIKEKLNQEAPKMLE